MTNSHNHAVYFNDIFGFKNVSPSRQTSLPRISRPLSAFHLLLPSSFPSSLPSWMPIFQVRYLTGGAGSPFLSLFLRRDVYEFEIVSSAIVLI